MNHKQVIHQHTRTSKLGKLSSISQEGYMHGWFRSIAFVTLFLLLASCTQTVTPLPQQDSVGEAWFTDEDLDNAVLTIPTTIQPIKGLDDGSQGSDDRAPSVDLPDIGLGDFETQAVLTNSTGFIYYIRKQTSSVCSIIPSLAIWRVIRQDQRNASEVQFLCSTREIQSVTGSADGTTVVISRKDTSANGNDFEIFKLAKSTSVVSATQLTNNTVNEIDVSMSGDGTDIIWQGKNPTTNVDAIFLNSAQNFLDVIEPQVQPSMSANGQFITLIRRLPDGKDRIMRFNVLSNTFTTIFTSVADLEHPSITDDGNKVVFLQNGTPNDIIRLRTVDTATTTNLVTGGIFQHPFITRDGRWLSYAQDQAGVLNVFTKHLSLGTVAQLSSVSGNSDATDSYWQLLAPFVTETKRTAFDGQEGDDFGDSIDMDGDILVVGSPDALQNDAGAVYIFERDLGGINNWGLRKKLVASDADLNDSFGRSVTISGDVVVVGADGENNIRGAIYIFRRNQGGSNNWGQFRKRVASDSALDDNFGISVDISGDTIVVGARRNDDSGNNSGSAYIFKQNQGGTNQWGEVKKLLASDAADGDEFGRRVAISTDVVVVGSIFDNNAKGSNAGAIYIFERNQGGIENWGEVKKRLAGDGTPDDSLGLSVAIDGDVVIAGSAADGGGAAYLYERNRGGSNNWGQAKKIVSSDLISSDRFSVNSVAIQDNRVVAGEILRGGAYIFERSQGGTNNWGEIRKLTASDAANTTTDQTFGSAITLEGDTVVVGALSDDEVALDAGTVYIYE